jgi:hypothetical protein
MPPKKAVVPAAANKVMAKSSIPHAPIGSVVPPKVI